MKFKRNHQENRIQDRLSMENIVITSIQYLQT